MANTIRFYKPVSKFKSYTNSEANLNDHLWLQLKILIIDKKYVNEIIPYCAI